MGMMDLGLASYDAVMNVNARGYFLCTRAAIPALIKRGGDAIIYTSSGASFLGMPVRIAYSMSKAAVNALMRSVASRFGPQGVRANALTPGMCVHDGVKEHMSSEQLKAIEATVPLGRLGSPEDVAAMSAFLMSDGACYVSGQLISVDGGKTMRQ